MNEGIKEYVTEMIGEGKDFFEILEGLKARIPLGECSDDYYDEVLEMCDRANIKSVGSTTEELRNYYETLSVLDWYYDYSDDHSVWTRGNESYRAATNLRYESEQHYQMWNEFSLWVKGLRDKPLFEEFAK